MKPIISLTLLLSGSTFAANAKQAGPAHGADTNVILFIANALSILSAIAVAAFFLISIIRLFLNYRLRRALIEKNASEQVISQLLPVDRDLSHQALKWCCLLTAAGVGLTICYFSQPVGLHWAIIMSFSLAAGLFIFYFIEKRLSKNLRN